MSLPTLYQEYIHKSRYARWLPEAGRRELWEETVSRYFNFFDGHLKDNNNYQLSSNIRSKLEKAVLGLEVMPSMRCLMTAGDALARENIAGYNCSFVAIDNPRAFDEILYVLMNGTGVGFTVERQDVNQLPSVSEEFNRTDTSIIVPDSKLGWAKALRELIAMLYVGQIPSWDLSRIRSAGTPLKTFGGRASGPEPLDDLFHFCIRIFTGASGRKLTSLECHDIVCKIADVVVVGGVRRSALLSLSNLSDERMRHAKSGQWQGTEGQRALSNNSACYTEMPDIGIFMSEWLALYESKSGERGIFSRVACQAQAEKTGRRDSNHDFGTNPCSEIILRPREFCNLSEAVIRENDNMNTLKEKVKLATILGTMQATLTNFRYITSAWSKNCEEERLLGVSLTGIMDNVLTNGKQSELPQRLTELKQVAIDTNKEWAKKFGINQAAAITCVKPSGTVSQLVDAASGIHARHSSYYIRSVRADKKDPLAKMMVDVGFPAEDDVMKPDHSYVFSFPMKSPDNAITRKDMTAIEQLEHWLIYQNYWCEHKPSCTVSVKEDEWIKVGAWVYDHFDQMSGISFLPFSDHVYKQAPYIDCDKRDYNRFKKDMPTLDWSKLGEYETTDQTIGSQELACSSADGCEV
jgi:ribonucleoside-triphosphate reductase (thioredoxin)